MGELGGGRNRVLVHRRRMVVHGLAGGRRGIRGRRWKMVMLGSGRRRSVLHRCGLRQTRGRIHAPGGSTRGVVRLVVLDHPRRVRRVPGRGGHARHHRVVRRRQLGVRWNLEGISGNLNFATRVRRCASVVWQLSASMKR